MEKPTIRIPWKQFVEAALVELDKNYPLTGSKIMEFKRHNHNGDYGIVEMPDFVEIEI